MDSFVVDREAGSPEYDWAPQPEVARFVGDALERMLAASEPARSLAGRLRALTGTRLIDWIDHLRLSGNDVSEQRLAGLGFQQECIGACGWWVHPEGLFPAIIVGDGQEIAIKVESVVDFLFANGLEGVAIDGAPLSRWRRAVIDDGQVKLSVIERHGYGGFDTAPAAAPVVTLLRHTEALLRRRRRFPDAAKGFAHAAKLIDAAAAELGRDRAADLFFAAERTYWTARNRAAQVQRARQDRLGLGWGNHDHHTYRSSRQHFAALIATLEKLGLVCRERFYAGDAAGWGAQVLEQPHAGIVVFADVDLTPEEVAGDFAHEPLPPSDRLGTVGLWCALHGEAFLEAGMHHLECQFDFDGAREQLHAAGVASMKPFTLFRHLKQGFTEPEMWPVDPARLAALLRQGLITREQADRFARDGAVGSHLEVLQRDDGYKGFNQTGISDIIRRTDPRHAETVVAAGA